MARFQELNEYIDQILLKLIQSQNLCKYIHYESNQNDPSDPLDSPDLTLNERKALMYTRIFPFPKLPNETELTAGTYLTVYFDNIEKSGSIYFKDSIIIFNIISHINQHRLLGKLRPYAMMNEIDEMFNDQKVIGIGKTQFVRGRFLWVNSSFSGYSLHYRITDFS